MLGFQCALARDSSAASFSFAISASTAAWVRVRVRVRVRLRVRVRIRNTVRVGLRVSSGDRGRAWDRSSYGGKDGVK